MFLDECNVVVHLFCPRNVEFQLWSFYMNDLQCIYEAIKWL